jgi:hypothetical protein
LEQNSRHTPVTFSSQKFFLLRQSNGAGDFMESRSLLFGHHGTSFVESFSECFFCGATFMNHKTLVTAITVVAALFVVPFASAEPKAYDAVFYKGKAGGLKIVLQFDYGYLEGSKIKITESGRKQTTQFYFSGRDEQAGTGKLRFLPLKGDPAKKTILLEMEVTGDRPSTIKGSYTAAGKTIPFTLRKRKKH